VLASSPERSDHHERLGGEDLFKSAPPFRDDDGLAERARCAHSSQRETLAGVVVSCFGS